MDEPVGVRLLPPVTSSQHSDPELNGATPSAPFAFFPLTDIGNADRLMHYHGSEIRYCYQTKKWYVWDGRRWAEDRTGAIDRKAESVARAILREAAKAESVDQSEKIAKWAMATMSNKGIKNMIERAQSKTPILVEHMDQHPFLLNCLNGTLDLTAGQLLPHDPAHLITKLIPIDYDPNAYCPTWNDFLHRIMDGRDHLIAFLQRAIGYALTGDTREQVIFILYGIGANGKSTLLNIVMQLMGELAAQASTKMLMAKKSEAISNDVADLRGMRFVSTVETGQGRRMDEELVKQLSGGDPITARRLHENNVTFVPQFKVFLATNHKPEIRGTDEGIWRRLPLIPFSVTIPEPERDKSLPSKLQAELPGILTWALRGCLNWQQDGLGIPDEVKNASAEYRAEMDIMQGFLEECCVLGPTRECTGKELYATYQKWCEESGEQVVSKKAFSQRLVERPGIERERTGSARKLIGVAPRTEQQEML